VQGAKVIWYARRLFNRINAPPYINKSVPFDVTKTFSAISFFIVSCDFSFGVIL